MEIDDRIEALVRRMLGAVIRRNEAEVEEALRAFPDDAARIEGLRLATAICGFVVFDTYGGRPTAEETRLLANSVAAMEKWVDLGADEANTYLTAILDATPLEDVLSPDSAVMLTYIVTGSLLASSARLAEDEPWWNYLDRVEAAIEAAPAN